MINFNVIIESVTALDANEKRMLRDMLDSQLSAPAVMEDGRGQDHPLIGLLADDQLLADEILVSAMTARESRPLRVVDE